MQETARTMQQAIGRTVNVRIGSLSIPCRVIDARQVFDRRDLLVEPVGGTGQEWVSLHRCTLPTDALAQA